MKNKLTTVLNRLLDDLLLITLVNNGLGRQVPQYVQKEKPKA